MDRKTRNELNIQIYEEACEWFVQFRGGQIDAARRRELAAWLRKSPEHLRAYLEIAAIWHDGPSLDPTGKWDEAALLAQIEDEPDNIVAHPNQSHAYSSPTVHPTVRNRAHARRWSAVAVAASFLMAVLGVWLYSERNVYATDIGEQRSIRLADGSTVDLNSRSKIEVRYSEGERMVALLQGQALFQVAKNPHRPFIVISGETRVRAVGTQFDVNRKASGTVVTVIEGRVAVLSDVDAAVTPEAWPPGAPEQAAGAAESRKGAIENSASAVSRPATKIRGAPARTPEPPILLSAGEQLRLASADAPQIAPANVASATAWKQHQLVFDSATLADVVEEFNRYNERQLTIQDVELDDLHITGVFSTVDPRGLLDFLRARPGIEITETSTGYQIAKKISP